MTDKKQSNNNEWRLTGGRLLGMEINTLGDAKNFFVGINTLASQMSSDTVLLDRLHSISLEPASNVYYAPQGSDLTIKDEDMYTLKMPSATHIPTAFPVGSFGVDGGNFTQSVASVLAYGQAVGEDSLFFAPNSASANIIKINDLAIKSTTSAGYKDNEAFLVGQNTSEIKWSNKDWSTSKEITSPFIFSTQQTIDTIQILKELPQIRDEVAEVRKEAKEDLDKLRQIQEQKSREQDKEIESLKITINGLKQEIKDMTDASKGLIHEEEIVIGSLAYNNHSIFYNKSRLEDLPPQAVKLCRLFMCRPDELILDDTIRDVLTVNDYMTTLNMQKLVSDLRAEFRDQKIKVAIKRIGNQGYIFITKEIR